MVAIYAGGIADDLYMQADENLTIHMGSGDQIAPWEGYVVLDYQNLLG